MIRCCSLLLLILPGVWGQTAGDFQGRKAWKIETNKLRVTVLQGGGHLAELTLRAAAGEREVNPLWIPPWPSIEPSTYNRDKHGAIYGTDSEAATLAGIMGHNVCFDYWGAPSGAEFRAGLSYHGEVNTLAWTRLSGGSGEITYRADLPESRTSLLRTLRLRPDQNVLYFEETAENKTAFDRPFGWVQHVTFGPPFVDAAHCFFDASGTRAEHRSGSAVREFQWPQAPGKDFRRFSNAAASSDMAYVLLDPARDVEFVSALNTEHRLLVAYLFHRRDYPWLNVWEQNRDRTEPPWNGRAQTRGMEFGNTRAAGTARAWLRMPMLWDTPTFGWLDGRGRQTVRYLAVTVRIPAGFDRVRDIRVQGSDILIEGATSIRVPFDPSLF